MSSAPENLSALVIETFAQTLRCDVAPQDSFFELGGDSLAAEAALTALSEAVGQDLPLWLLLDHPSPEELTTAIQARLAR